MTTILPAPTYVLARAAWISTLVIWHADGRFTPPRGRAMRRLRGGAGRELAAAAGLSPARWVDEEQWAAGLHQPSTNGGVYACTGDSFFQLFS